jgi:hypothetical protein
MDLWKYMHLNSASLATHADSPPASPWIAANPTVWMKGLQETSEVADKDKLLLDVMHIMQFAGDFERCLAWGFADWAEQRKV